MIRKIEKYLRLLYWGAGAGFLSVELINAVLNLIRVDFTFAFWQFMVNISGFALIFFGLAFVLNLFDINLLGKDSEEENREPNRGCGCGESRPDINLRCKNCGNRVY